MINKWKYNVKSRCSFQGVHVITIIFIYHLDEQSNSQFISKMVAGLPLGESCWAFALAGFLGPYGEHMSSLTKLFITCMIKLKASRLAVLVLFSCMNIMNALVIFFQFTYYNLSVLYYWNKYDSILFAFRQLFKKKFFENNDFSVI